MFLAPLLRSLDADTAHAMLLSYIGERGITAYPVPITVEDVGGVEQAKAIILFMVSETTFLSFLNLCFPILLSC